MPPHALADFDFDFQPSLDRKLVGELSTLRWVDERRNVILLGPPGVGKTHLGIALGVAATEAGYRTYFTSAADMVQKLQSAHLEGTALYKLRTYTGPTVLVIDELGYLPLDQSSANWIFQVVSRRYEKQSPVVLTSNRGFSDWVRSSPTRLSPPPSSTASSTTPWWSTSAAAATACVRTKTPPRPRPNRPATAAVEEVIKPGPQVPGPLL